MIRRIVNTLLLILAMNWLLLALYVGLEPVFIVLAAFAAILLQIIINAAPCRVANSAHRLRSVRRGYELLLLFSASFLVNAAVNIFVGVALVPGVFKWWVLVINIAVCLIFELALLLNGLFRAFLTSLQLGIKWRVLVFFFWWMPGVNVFLLSKVCRLLRDEYEFETMRNELDHRRGDSEICRTQYPLVLVHGVFFRDFRYFNYWGRIPKALMRNGAVIHLGRQQSAASVKDTAGELAARIEEIVRETGCEKVNIIAHSKGGLDVRYAVSRLGLDRYTASVTTINTPHRGCHFADTLLEKTPEKVKNTIARRYNAALKKLGDTNPDFITAVTDLTASSCRRFNEETPDKDGVYYQSVASKMIKWTNGKFPMNLSHILVRPFDGENDGLVSVESAKWGSRCIILTPDGQRGISHGDVIDLNRENIDGFDVRELYVDIVKGLKAMGF